MNSDISSILSNLEKFLSSSNMEIIRSDFYNSFLDESGNVAANSFINDDGVFINDDFFSLQDNINSKIFSLFIITQESINRVINEEGVNRLPKITNILETSFKYIQSKFSTQLRENPYFKNELDRLRTYLFSKHGIQLNLKGTTKKDFDSTFRIKESINKRHVVKLYKFSVDNDFFEIDEVSEDQFIEVLTLKNTDCKIRFSCNTPLLIAYLRALKPLFKNFDKNKIAYSKRFLTKNGSLLTLSNFNSYYRINEKSKVIEAKLTEFIDSQSFM